MFKIKTKLLSVIFACLLFATPASAEFFSDVILTGTQGIWMDSRSYTSLQTAVVAAGGADREIVIVGEQAATALTVPANVRLRFLRDGSINNSGQLTISTRNITAEDRQIFTGTGDIDFVDGSVVRSSWFSNLVEALDVTLDDTLTMVVSETGRITSNAVVGNDVVLEWESSDNLIIIYGGRVLSNVRHLKAGSYQIFAGAGDVDFLDNTDLRLSWFRRLRTATAWIETEEVSLTIDADSTMIANVTVPSSLTLKFIKGNTITTTGYTLTINGPLDCGIYPAFSGTGAVTFGTTCGFLENVSAAWFGARGDDPTVNSTPFIQRALDSLQSAGGTVVLPLGNFRVESTIYLRGGTVGETNGTTSLRGSGIAGATAGIASVGTRLISHIDDGSPALSMGFYTGGDHWSVLYHSVISNLSLSGLTTQSYDAIGIQMWCYHSRIKDVEISRFSTGIDIRLQNNYVINSLIGAYNANENGNDIGIHLQDGNNAQWGDYGPEASVVQGCKIQGNHTGIKIGSDGTRRTPSRLHIYGNHFNSNIGSDLGGNTDPRSIDIVNAGPGINIDDCSFEPGNKADHICVHVGSADGATAEEVTSARISNCTFGAGNSTRIREDNAEHTTISNCYLGCPNGTKIERTQYSDGLQIISPSQRTDETNDMIYGDTEPLGGTSGNNLITNGSFQDWAWIGSKTAGSLACPAGWFAANANQLISRETDVPIANVGKYSCKVLAGDNVAGQFLTYARLKAGVTYSLEFAIKSDTIIQIRFGDMNHLTFPSTGGVWKFFHFPWTATATVGLIQCRFDIPINNNGKYFQLAYVSLTEGSTPKGLHQASVPSIYTMNISVPMAVTVTGGAVATTIVHRFYLHQKHKIVRIDSYFATPYADGDGGDTGEIFFQHYDVGAWTTLATAPLTSAANYNGIAFPDAHTGVLGWIEEEDVQANSYRVVIETDDSNAGAAPTAPANGNITLHILYDKHGGRENY